MTRMKSLLAATAISLVGACALGGAALAAEDPHHPTAETAPPSPQAAPEASPGMAGQPGMMNGMNGMGGSNMMSMMKMMGCGDAAGMGMVDHVEGRIAFLRTELHITEAQSGAWEAFATALRTNAQSLGAARGAMMGGMSGGQTLAQRLDAQELWLTARLDGTRTIKIAFSTLYGALSDEQKTSADELLASHMGMGMMMASGMGH